MRCVEMEEMISLYIDNQLDEHTKEMIDKHLKECSECKKEYEELLVNIRLCQELPMIDLPDDFEEGLHQKLLDVRMEDEVQECEREELILPLKRKKKKINWRKYTSVAAIFIVCILSGLALANNIWMGGTKEDALEDESAHYGVQEEKKVELKSYDRNFIEQAPRGIAKSNHKMMNERKVIERASIHIDIENFDQRFNEIAKMTKSLGGYIENSNVGYKHYAQENIEESLKRGNMTIRVPKNIFMNVIERIKGMGHVTNENTSGQDITSGYRDTVSEVENLKIQEKRLREIMDQAKKVSDILEVEKELTRVRGDINRMTGNIKKWDNLISLSTIEVSLNEVASKDQIKPVSNRVIYEAKKGFIETINRMVEFFEELFILLISVSPIIVPIGILGALVVYYIRKRIKNKG